MIAVRSQAAATLVLATLACAPSTATSPRAREAALDRIASECGLARSTLLLVSNSELRFQPPPDATYESVDCALRRIRGEFGLRTLPIGFVGNEAPAETEPNAQAD